ncbi:hypothetical protein ACROYT_G040041 [Oculina patagonica]
MDVTRRTQDIFKPQETHDNPFDVTLVAEDGTEFKAHRKVLSEASPFFEKLLSSGMIESKKREVRLEMLTEAGLGAVLEFIYTGGVQMLAEDNARDLIEMADYLFILPLKTLAERVLAQTLNTSNCISTYYFAERYECKELISDAKKLIHANFTDVAKAEEFLNLSCEEVNEWISSDEIVVSAEEDVFKIILSWIDHNKRERKKYFADLLRQVRLVYVLRDYLFNDIVANDLVNDNACCLTLVKEALKAIDSNNFENISVPFPRKSIETSVIVVCIRKGRLDQLLCYDPRANTWYELRDTSLWLKQIVSCHGTLYSLSRMTTGKRDFVTYIPYTGKRDLQQIFVSENSEEAIYALESETEKSCPCCVSLQSCYVPPRVSEFSPCGKRHLSYITKYKPESNSWEDISSFDLGLRTAICVVAKDNFIYFIGGRIGGPHKVLADVDRYDLSRRKWEKLANLQEARQRAYGTASREKVFVTGGWSEAGVTPDGDMAYPTLQPCEVFNESTNEWQIIASLKWSHFRSMMCVDEKVYVVDDSCSSSGERGRIECYDPDMDDCNVITKIPVPDVPYGEDETYSVRSFSMRVLLGGNLQWTQLIT